MSLQETPSRPPTWPLLSRLWRDWVRPHVRVLAGAIVFMVGVAGATAAYPLVIKWTFEAFEQKDAAAVWIAPLIVIAVTLARGGFLYIQTQMMNVLVLRIGQDMQNAMFAHLTHADLARLTRDPVGTLVSRFTNDLLKLQDAIQRLATNLLRDVLTVLALIGTMLYLDWLLTLVVLGLYPLAAYPVVAISQRLRKLARHSQEQIGETTALIGESLSGARMIKTYGLESYETARAAGAFERLVLLNRRITRNRAMIDPLLEAFGGLAVAGVLGFVGWRLLSGATTLGDFTGFITALIMAAQPVRAIGSLNAAMQEGLAGAERVFGLLDEAPGVTDAPDARPLAVTGGRISFRDVTFAYGAGRPALSGVSFEAEPGTTVALVGPSGGGKSTVINLIPRLFDVTAGAVLIDGSDVRAATLASLRGSMALVSQEIVLFDDTVAANIGFGRAGASREEIEAAARAAAAHGFISALPQGYDARVGERGGRLSGGQRQRIAIARAMLKNAPILLLDEATSALDSESERQVQEALSVLMRGRTTIVIAHRLSTVMHADQILVLDEGRIVERGTHGELIARAGLYARLHATQFDGPAPARPVQATA